MEKDSTTIVLRDDLSEANLRKLNADYPVRQIAARLDVSAGTVYAAFTRHGITPADHDIENHKPDLEARLYQHLPTYVDQGLTAAQIAAAFDCSVQTIYTYLKELELELVDRPPRTRRPELLNLEAVTDLYFTQQLGIRETANIIGCSSKTLRVFMDDHGMQRRQNSKQLDSQQIAADYLAGATLKQLAEQHDCAVSVITSHLDSTETPRRKAQRRPPKLDNTAVAAAYQQGASVEQVAKQFKCGYRTIKNVLDSAGIKLRR